jgi:hypothetical protein
MMEKLTFNSRYLNPLTDFGFHKIFGSESRKGRPACIGSGQVRDAMNCAREEGREEGCHEGNVAIVQRCKQKNLPIEDIIELTGFSKEQILQCNL